MHANNRRATTMTRASHERHLRVTSSLIGGPVERKRFLRERVWPRLPAKPLALFGYMYLVRGGFLDGRAGLAFCVFHAFQEFMVGVKLEELRRTAR